MHGRPPHLPGSMVTRSRRRMKTARRVDRGGVREGAGRNPSGRSGRTVRLADSVRSELESEAARAGVSVSTAIERRVLPVRRIAARSEGLVGDEGFEPPTFSV